MENRFTETTIGEVMLRDAKPTICCTVSNCISDIDQSIKRLSTQKERRSLHKRESSGSKDEGT